VAQSANAASQHEAINGAKPPFPKKKKMEKNTSSPGAFITTKPRQVYLHVFRLAAKELAYTA